MSGFSAPFNQSIHIISFSMPFQDAGVIIKYLRGLNTADLEKLTLTIDKHGPHNAKIGLKEHEITRDMVDWQVFLSKLEKIIRHRKSVFSLTKVRALPPKFQRQPSRQLSRKISIVSESTVLPPPPPVSVSCSMRLMRACLLLVLVHGPRCII